MPIKSHLVNLINLCLVDDNFADSELEVLIKRGELLGWSQEEIRELVLNPQHSDFTYPSKIDDVIAAIYDIVKIIIADEVIHENEKDWFRNYLRKIKVKDEKIEIIVQKSLENEILKNDISTLRETIKNDIQFNI